MTDPTLTEIICRLSKQEREILTSAASSPDSEFIAICQLHFFHLSREQALRLKVAARAGVL